MCCGCDGLAFVTLHNKTRHDITITTKPELLFYRKVDTAERQTREPADSMTYRLAPDRALHLMGGMMGMWFSSKIREQELPIYYLRIETATDTIVADSKTAIMQLMNQPPTKYNRNTDRAFATDNKRNFRAIIVR